MFNENIVGISDFFDTILVDKVYDKYGYMAACALSSLDDIVENTHNIHYRQQNCMDVNIQMKILVIPAPGYSHL